MPARRPRKPKHNPNAPLEIATIRVGAGAIGITFAPGKKQAKSITGPHRRDLDTDLDAIKAWGACAVVTLVEDFELLDLKITGIEAACHKRGIAWHHMPIRDVSVPSPAFNRQWPVMSLALRSILERGGRVLVHCRGGLGRAGMVSARLLVDTGMWSDMAAIDEVRAVRPGAIETWPQERWVGGYKPVKQRTRRRRSKTAFYDDGPMGGF